MVGSPNRLRRIAAYTYSHNSQGNVKPFCVVEITDMSEGAVIEAGVNDEFKLEMNDVKKIFTIPTGDY